MSEIFSILQIYPPKPTGTGGETHKINSGQGKPNYGMYILVAIAFIGIMGIVFQAGQSSQANNNQQQNSDPKPPIQASAAGAGIIAANQAANTGSTNPSPAQVGQEKGKIKMPTNTYIVGAKIDIFPISNIPKSFYIRSRKMLYSNVVIGSTEISGTYTLMGSIKEIVQLGGTGGFRIEFYKNGVFLTTSDIVPKCNYEAGTGTFAVKRKPDTFEADSVSLNQQ